MNAIYSCCTVDPWVDVVRILQNKYGIEPVYWIGKSNDNSRKIIPSEFPDTIYHDYFNAWKGVFPAEIERIANRYCVDIDFYRRISNEELLGLTQMDRMDEDQHSFGFLERRNLFRKLLRYWIAVVDFYEINIMISPKIPHQTFDYILYLLCQQKGIKIFTTVHTAFSSAGRIIANDNLVSLPERIKNDYDKLKASKSKFQLSGDIVSYLSVVNRKYEDAIPKNFIEYNRFHKKNPSVFQTALKFLYELRTKSGAWFGREGFLRYGVPKYRKESRMDVEASRTRYKLFPYVNLIYRRIGFLKSLKREYSSLAREPVFDKPYVIFALHYQPEATSLPTGGIFHDQLYVLELLSRYLPRDWNIFVKENPKQFNPLAEGATSRLLRFYRDIKKFSRVSLIPVDYNPFILIDRAKGVVTIAGTIGWEAMVRKKPVICFGNAWYHAFSHGVLRINNNRDLGKMVEFIANYEYSEHKLMAYLKSIEMNSFVAYIYRELKEKLNQTKDQCVGVLVKQINRHFETNINATE